MVEVVPIRKPPSRAPEWATITKDFGDGTYSFGLTWANLADLEDKLGGPLLPVLLRLSSNQWSVKEPPEIIRLALVGGGLEPIKAIKLVRTYVEQRPPSESVPLATEILSAALLGPPAAPEEKPNDEVQS